MAEQSRLHRGERVLRRYKLDSNLALRHCRASPVLRVERSRKSKKRKGAAVAAAAATVAKERDNVDKNASVIKGRRKLLLYPRVLRTIARTCVTRHLFAIGDSIRREEAAKQRARRKRPA